MPEQPITSNPSADSPNPWFEFTVDSATMDAAISNASGIDASPLTTDAATDDDPLGDYSLSLTAGKEGERHVLAVRLDGTVEFVAVSDQQEVYYAHLAWYDPSTGEVTQLVFQE